MDTSIAMGYKPVQIEGPMNQLARMMQLDNSVQQNQLGNAQLRQQQRDFDNQNAMAKLYADPTFDQNSPDAFRKVAAISPTIAQAFQKSQLENRKNLSELDDKEQSTAEKVVAHYRDLAGKAATPESAVAFMTAMNQDPRLKNTPYGKATLAQLTEGMDVNFAEWRSKAGLGNTKFAELNKPTLTNVDTGGKKLTYSTPGMGGARTLVGEDKINVSPDTIYRENHQAEQGRLNRGMQIRGQDLTNARQNDRLEFDKTKPAATKTGPMSVTLQKELLESDDAVQSSKAIVGTLENALKINEDAYSGYAAKGRAVLASNLVPWQTTGADKTIDLDNMMTGQALESLKAVFGGMPTEGERKILLDMQASADKTPTQREAIIKRAISAAERRAAYAGQKAKAIRSGEYLTQGAQSSEPVDIHAEADAILNGGK